MVVGFSMKFSTKKRNYTLMTTVNPRTLSWLLVCLQFALPALAFMPVLSNVQPRGGQRGTEMTIRLSGDRLYDPEEILFYQSGISVSKLEVVGDDHKAVKATISIAPDAPLGEHLMRLRCKGGLSYQRSFWVGEYPTIMEARNKERTADLNSNFDRPQKIEINQTIQGVADKEDADYYVVQCRKGQRLSVEVEGMRLGRTLFDPYVAILNRDRFELASSDDTALLFRDCAASIIIPEDGPYTVLVRESSYKGTGACQYRLHVGEFPRPTAIYPPGAQPGKVHEFTFVGDPAGDLISKIEIPNTTANYRAFIENGGWHSPSGLPVRISSLPFYNEAEPNEGSAEASPVEAPPVPVAFHGILSK